VRTSVAVHIGAVVTVVGVVGGVDARRIGVRVGADLIGGAIESDVDV